MNRPPLGGLWLVKLPVRDLDRSLTWYRQVFAVVPEMEFRDEHGVLQGVTCSLPGIADTRIAFRQDPQAAEGYAGFDPVAWHVVDPDEPGAQWRFELEAIGRTVRLRQHVTIGPGFSGTAAMIRNRPEREQSIFARRLAQLKASMQATVEGIKALAESAD